MIAWAFPPTASAGIFPRYNQNPNERKTMPKKTPTEPKTPRAPRQQSPEIVEAKKECADRREQAEAQCKLLMAQARQAARVRKLTESMSPEAKAALKAVL